MNVSSGVLLLNRYQLERELGSGAYGVVWKAVDLTNGDHVAIKLLKTPDASNAIRRFELEVKTLKALRNPYCVQLRDHGTYLGVPFLVLDFIDGEPLRTWMRRPHSDETKVDVARQLALGIQAAHRSGVLHRDLKPENIMVSRGPRPVVTVLDFGISRLAGAHPTDITKTGELNGTPGYMSPEQLRAADVGPPTDVYALGVIFFELFEGRPPFDAGRPMATALEHVGKPAPPCTAAPMALRPLIDRMLLKEPSQRPSMQAIRSALGGPEVPIRTGPRPRPPWQWLAIAAAVAVVVGLVSIALRPDEQPRRVTAPRIAPTALTQRVTPEPPPVDLGEQPETRVSKIVQLTTTDIPTFAYFPASFDPDSPAAVVWLIHDIGLTGRSILDYPDYRRLSEETGRVLIAPDDSTELAEVWLAGSDRIALESALKPAHDELNLPTHRRFLIAHGGAGLAINDILCEHEFLAVAYVSFRDRTDSAPCSGKHPPTMVISGMNDGSAPVAGGEPCLLSFNRDGHEMLSLEDHEDGLRTAYGCRKSTQDNDASCETPKCRDDLVLCRDPGGRYLPRIDFAVPDFLHPVLVRCGGFLAESPANRVWEFFDAYDSVQDESE